MKAKVEASAPVAAAPKFKIQARGSFVLVKLVKVKESKGGILLNDVRQHEQREAVVVSVGEGLFTHSGSIVPCGLVEGDLVSLRVNRGQPVTFGGENYLWLDQSDIPLVIRRADGSTFQQDLGAALMEALPAAGKIEVGVKPKESGVEGDPD